MKTQYTNNFFLRKQSIQVSTYYTFWSIYKYSIIWMMLVPIFLWSKWLSYFRLTPCYAVVLMIYTFILPYLFDGPYWKTDFSENCRSHWWQNLLYINNIYKLKQGVIIDFSSILFYLHDQNWSSILFMHNVLFILCTCKVSHNDPIHLKCKYLGL